MVILPRQITVFLIVGILTVSIDYVTYTIILASELTSVSLAKGVGFFSGSVFAYLANRLFTFRATNSQKVAIIRFIVVYLSSLAANVLVNSCSLHYMQTYSFAIPFSFCVALCISVPMNFVGMKYFVFR